MWIHRNKNFKKKVFSWKGQPEACEPHVRERANISAHINIGVYREKLQSMAFILSLVSANSFYSEKSCHSFYEENPCLENLLKLTARVFT